MSVNGHHGWPQGYYAGTLHELRCEGWERCACAAVYPVRTWDNRDAGLSSESHRILDGVPGGAQPTAGAPFSLEG